MSLSDAYDYTDKLKDQLMKDGKVKDVSLEFKDINDNAERVKFLENLLSSYDLIAGSGKMKMEKSSVIAESCRLRGNQFYSLMRFLDALEAYNQCLCFAEPGSKTIGIAYANRSAVYYELKLFENSLRNIQMAKQNNYPEENLAKLEKREVMCLEMINNRQVLQAASEPKGSEYLRMSRRPNEKLPFIADCLELKSDAKFGRYITTKSALRPGEVVCVEEPFTKLLLPAHRYKYCASCLNDNFLDLIACSNCTSTMFCSDECARNGSDKFHDFECPIIDKLNALGTKILRIAVRTFFEALEVCDGRLSELKALIDENCGTSRTVFDFEHPMERKNVLQAIDALATNEGERNHADLFQRSGIVAIIINLFLKHTPVKDLLESDDDRDFFRRFIFKQTQISASNYHGLFNGVVRKSELETNPQYGSGSFPFCSLINHSCAPNLVRVTFGCRNYAVINRPVAAGEQLFDNYGFHHCLESFNDRQTSLFNQYMFKCSCDACTKRFPLFSDLPMVDRKFQKFLSDDVQKLAELNVQRAKDKFQSYCDYLQKFDSKYPCWEISSVQECLLRCFTIFTMSEFKLKFCAK